MSRGTLTSTAYEVPGDAAAFFEVAEREGWSDGLPLIPPTEERVQAMLEFADEPPHLVRGSVCVEARGS